jgi:hypothetical protein
LLVRRRVWALPRGESSFVTLVVPELFRKPSLAWAIRRPEFALKQRLLREPGVVITDVPVVASERVSESAPNAVCRILVSGAHAASMRAANYAGTLGIDDTRAVFFAFDADEADELRADGPRRQCPCPWRSRRPASAISATRC